MRRRERTGVAVLAVVCCGVVLVTVDMFIVNVAFPAIQESFHGARLASLSWILNAYAIVFAAALVPAGRVSDLLGRKPALLFGIVLFTAASGLCAAATNLDLLVGARALQAIGAATIVPSSLGLLLAAFPPERRGPAIRIWASSSGVAAAIGPVLGGILVEANWRWIFLVNLPIGSAALLAASRYLPSPPRQREPHPDLIGMVLLALSAGALVLGLVEGDGWDWSSSRTVASFAIAFSALVLFLARSRRHPSPVIEFTLFRNRSFAAASASMVLFGMSFSSMLLATLVWEQTGWAWSPLRAALAFAPGPIMVPLVSVAAGRAAGRLPAATLVTAGMLAYATGVAIWLTSIGLHPNYLEALLPGVLLTGAGVGLTLPTLTATAVTSLPPERFATGSAIATMARQLGYAIGVAGLVVLIGTPRSAARLLSSYRHGWEFVALAAAATALSALLLIKPAPGREASLEPELETSR